MYMYEYIYIYIYIYNNLKFCVLFEIETPFISYREDRIKKLLKDGFEAYHIKS